MGSLTCPACGIYFSVPDRWEAARHEDKRSFYCPNGHSQSFTRSTADELRLERDRLKQQLAQRDDDINFWKSKKDAAERRVSAAKGQITRLKKRAKAGTCPCCNRTFANMAEHMRRQHPEFDPKVVELEDEKRKRA